MTELFANDLTTWYMVFFKYCVFFQEFIKLCNLSLAQLGCCWLFRKWPRSDCTLRSLTGMSWSPVCRGWVAVNWEKTPCTLFSSCVMARLWHLSRSNWGQCQHPGQFSGHHTGCTIHQEQSTYIYKMYNGWCPKKGAVSSGTHHLIKDDLPQS